ncbi:MAG: hypothetical protein KJ737_04095 [Proteobacteria bacterium]|nr:hypothetical protein [Pseudomonadota bacterium]
MKKNETINQILKKMRNNLTPPKGQTTSIDPKKMARVIEDVEVAKEIIKQKPKPEGNGKEKDK